MKIIKMKIAELTPYEKNAKEHPRKQIEEIKNSIKKFGFCDPVGIWGGAEHNRRGSRARYRFERNGRNRG